VGLKLNKTAFFLIFGSKNIFIYSRVEAKAKAYFSWVEVTRTAPLKGGIPLSMPSCLPANLLPPIIVKEAANLLRGW
jgi:hypothetical protein